MERASLALRVPAALLPSTARPPVDGEASGSSGGAAPQPAPTSEASDTSSVASELRGLILRPISLFSRSASGPAARKPPAAERELHRTATGVPASSQIAGASSTHPAPQAPAAPSEPAQAALPPPAAQRLGSRQTAGSAAPDNAVPAAPAAAVQAAAPASTASRSASPEQYSDDEFEAEESSRSGRPAGSPTASSPGAASSVGASSLAAQLQLPAASERSRSPSPAPSSSTASRGRSLGRAGSGISYLAPTGASAKRQQAAAPSSRASSRPGSASPCKPPARPISAGRPALEARVARQMEQDPADWTCAEVCDWLELIGLGQYRRRFVHNAVSGALLLRLSNEQLKSEVGIGPLGHREGLLTAINELEQYWAQRQASADACASHASGEDREIAAGSPGSPGSGGRPGSAGPPGLGSGQVDYGLQRAFAQRARLLRDLDKAEGREAQRKKAAEQALRVAGQAGEEVRRLQASICQLDASLGWHDAAEAQRFDPTDVHGALAWQPAGKQRAPPRRPGSAGPLGGGRCGSPGSGGAGGAMSPLSRRIMEAQGAGSPGGSGAGFLDRLSRDVEARQAKAAAAARRAGRYSPGAAEEAAAQAEREARDLQLLREAVEARDDELAEALGSGQAGRVAQACDEVADTYQQELGLSDEAVEAVKRARSPARKAAHLAGALRTSQFMSRLSQDLSSRGSRLQELQHKYLRAEVGESAERQEAADVAAAQAHFALLGWPPDGLQAAAKAAAAEAPTDELLAALLRRAAALQEARAARGKAAAVDWEGAQWKKDRLAELQAEHNGKLAAALAEQQAAAAAEEAAQQAGKRGWAGTTARKQLQQPGNYLLESVELLAGCRPAEVAMLEGLAGYSKLLMTWRAIRGQKFVAFTRKDLEQRTIKAAELEQQVYPDNTRRLPKQDFDAFFDRLMADTQRRAQNREELAEKARAEALAKLMKSAPQPRSSHRRPATAGGGGRAGGAPA